MNLVTGGNLDLELANFLVNCIDLGESEYKKFNDERLEKNINKAL